MSRTTAGLPARLRRRLARRAHRGDDGFVLLESIIAISLITVVMGALGVLFVTSVANATHERTRAAAVQVATTALDGLSSYDPTSLVSGRSATAVAAQFASAQAVSAPVNAYLDSMSAAYDTDPNSSGSPTVPTTPTTQQIGNRSYTLSQYLGWCEYSVSPDGTARCTKSVADCGDDGGSGCYLRAVVAVSWTAPHCTPASCTYVTSQLISSAIDPTFLMNQPLPPAPVVATPGDQVGAVGDEISLQLLVKQDTGVPTFTWAATGLPAGLQLSPLGLITGTPSEKNSAPASVTVTVTDAFLRQASTTFSWRIFPKLEITAPSQAQTSTTMASVTTDDVDFPLTATGGQGAPYTWSLAGGTLPAGLSINSPADGGGAITGTPSTAGQYSFTLRVTDASGTRSATTKTITWTVTYPPIAASNPGTQTGATGSAVSLHLDASGGSGSYAWSDPTNSLDGTGLTLASDGRISGTLPGTTGAFAISLTVTDQKAHGDDYVKTIAFTWRVVAPPTVDAAGTRAVAENQAVSGPLDYTCPNGPCTLSLTGAPAGLTLEPATVATGSGSVRITGTVSSSAAGGAASAVYHPGVTITDNDGLTGDAGTGRWTVTAMLSVDPDTAPGGDVQFARRSEVSGTASVAGAGTYRFSLTGAPRWLSIDPDTGEISGRAPYGRSEVAFTVRATSDATSTSRDITWYVDDLGWSSIPDRHGTSSLDVAGHVHDGSGGTTFRLLDAPAWVTLTGSTLTVDRRAAPASGTVTVAVTDSVGSTQRTSFTWTLQ